MPQTNEALGEVHQITIIQPENMVIALASTGFYLEAIHTGNLLTTKDLDINSRSVKFKHC